MWGRVGRKKTTPSVSYGKCRGDCLLSIFFKPLKLNTCDISHHHQTRSDEFNFDRKKVVE
jgi:hypothetical protein